MVNKGVIQNERISANVIASLDSRDVAIWIRGLPRGIDRSALLRFLGFPWRLAISEVSEPGLFRDLQTSGSIDDPLVRKRGYVQIVDSDPSRIELPDRSLPFYLLNGSTNQVPKGGFADSLRRLTMLESLRRSSPRELLVISDQEDPIPPDLKQLWSSGFRSNITILSANPTGLTTVEKWLHESDGPGIITFLTSPPEVAISHLIADYTSTYPEERHVIRVRDSYGGLRRLDITTLDEPERPILETYSLIEERDLAPLTATDLAYDDFVGFFRDPASSWKPYAAGLPWMRDPAIAKSLLQRLRNLDISGSEENCITYVAAESGAGGTTLVRALAWDFARQGYPVLVARPVPFVPEALPMTNFLSRIHIAYEEHSISNEATAGHAGERGGERSRRYEAPWLIVFDTLHWEFRESDLIRFKNELTKGGRPVCILLVTGPTMPLAFINADVCRLAELTHAIDLEEAQRLGVHLNQFLKAYGRERTLSQWEYFHREHTVRYVEGIAAFWVTLSFWIQGQYDLSESIQEWMYRCFKENTDNAPIRNAIIQIAALSSERVPTPEVLLPISESNWPMSQLLADRQSGLAAIGLVKFAHESERYWSLVHDILGRLLINALFYDYSLRADLGFADAKDAEHLRFLLLRRISAHSALGERAYRTVGEEFATTIFKIDPDHGHGNFVSLWREVLDALNAMPRGLRDTSRLFRHHSAISRRRIAKLDGRFYEISTKDRVDLLQQAVEDIRYALDFIDYVPGSETNLNLYNSLANAYFDLAEAEAAAGADPDRLMHLRNLGSDATRKAYGESPTNSFVIETYIKNLIQNARIETARAPEICIEGLGILFSALAMNEAGYRAAQLGSLADKLLAILFECSAPQAANAEPRTALEVLLQAWRSLASGGQIAELSLAEIPEERRIAALHSLRHPAGRGNMQVIRMTYDLLSIHSPLAFAEQLELLDQLATSDYRLPAQLKLEYGILLFQKDRPAEGERIFKDLRRLWKESDQIVQIPDRLRWLRGPDFEVLRTVNAMIGMDSGIRPAARVQEFPNSSVPFRPEEFGFRAVNAGMRFSGHVSFGHNGPFLRPVTAGPSPTLRVARG